MIGFWIFQVDLLMCHVHISTADHRLFLLKSQKICQEILFPLHTIFQTSQLTLGIRGIYRNKIKVLKL